MQLRFLIIFLLLSTSACNEDGRNKPENVNKQIITKTPFDKTKWGVKEGNRYPYREQMLDAVLYSDSIRTLKENEIIDLLGSPDNIKEEHLYYKITENRFGMWTLSTKTMVIKLSEDGSVDWIKTHG